MENEYTSVLIAELIPAVFRTNAFKVVVLVIESAFVPIAEVEAVVGVEPFIV